VRQENKRGGAESARSLRSGKTKGGAVRMAGNNTCSQSQACGGKTKGSMQSCASGENVFAKSASGRCRLSSQSRRAFKLAILLWCVHGRQCDFRCFLAPKVKAIPSQHDGCLLAGSRFTLWRSLFLLRSESVCANV
jgi:hypothetical protein